MPELPDVEGFRRYFRRYAEGKQIVSVTADADIVRNATPGERDNALNGRIFDKPDRHGKWLICPAGPSTLLLHFGMTGGLVWGRSESGRHPHDRLRLQFKDGELRYRNMRKLGGAWLADAGKEDAIIGALGPDAWEISQEDFARLLDGRKRSLKSALMDQELIAGLGNLTVDESLFHARPQSQEIGRLAHQLRDHNALSKDASCSASLDRRRSRPFQTNLDHRSAASGRNLSPLWGWPSARNRSGAHDLLVPILSAG